MFRKLLLVLVTLVVVAGLLYAGGYLLPAEVHVDTFVSIDAEAEHVRPVVEGLEGQVVWMARGAEALGMTGATLSHSGGPTEGVGLQVAWDTADRRIGTSTLAESTETEVRFDIDVSGTRIVRTLGFEQVGPLTRLTWAEDATLTDPIQRYLAVVMNKQVQRQAAAQLAAIQQIAEPIAKEARAKEKTEKDAERKAAEEAAAAALEAKLAAASAAEEDWEYEGQEGEEVEKKRGLLVPVGPK